MSREDLERLDDQWMAGINSHDTRALVGLLADDFVWYDWAEPEPIKDIVKAEEHLQGWFTAFPDARVRETRRVVADDAIAAEIEWTGTNTGPLTVGDMQVPATDKSVIGRGSFIARVRDGKFAEISAHPDIAGMMMQLGFMPGM